MTASIGRHTNQMLKICWKPYILPLRSSHCTLHSTLHAIHSTIPNEKPPSQTHAASATLTLYVVNFYATWHALHSTLNTPRSTLHSPPHTPHSPLSAPHSTLSIPHSSPHTLHITHCATLCSSHPALHTTKFAPKSSQYYIKSPAHRIFFNHSWDIF